MATKTQYWLVDDTGTYARANGVEERDRRLPRSFTEADEPKGSAFVWARHPDIAVPAKFPADSLEAWKVQGWEPGLPDEPASPFNGPVAGDVAPLNSLESPTPAAAKKEK